MRALKLFWLMTQKNLLVMRRSWVWTGLELVLPLIIGIPVSILIFQDDDYSTDKTPIYSQVVSPSLEFGSNFGYRYDWTLRDGISATWSNNDPYAWLARLNPSLTNSSPLPPITVDGLSWLDLQYRGWMDIFSIYHTIIAAIILPVMIHTGREIGSEKENGVKDFLSVMGLSPFIFISSHVFIGWIKGIIVVTAACIVPAMRLTNGLVSINVFFFFLPIYLYVLAAVVMSATVASVFNTSNSTIRVITIVHPLLVFLSVLDQTTPSIYNPWLSTVASLSYNGCLSRVFNAIQSYLYRNRALSFAELFEQTKYIFNIGPAICMLLFDIFWMSLIIIGAEFYYKSTDFSLFTFFKRIFSRGNKIHQGNIDEVKKLENSHEEIDKNLEADIVVENMTKIWGSTGDFAVQDMNLRARRGEVTVLLGHNGAGKSTTFSVICGITPQTSGIVKVNAQRVGYCPQGNALFERLTAMEHLWFFHQVKGAKNDWKIEGAQLLETLQMGEKKNTNSMALSGGMKRKLCLAMALIGDSKVVMLDEPTAGMDTGARQDVQRMLDIEKKNRTILFTTHYMDEAESLGDRIIIMVRGRDVASGSSQFLKRRFGTGYVLTIVMEDKSLRESSGLDILKEVKLFVSTATLTRFHGKQIEITLPQESQAAFSKLFAHLEDSQNLFGVSSFELVKWPNMEKMEETPEKRCLIQNLMKEQQVHKAEFSEMGTMRMFIAGNPENSPYSSIIDEAAKAKNIKVDC
ncbi:unnamed protein product, partial [Mesorhabditis belari]|uniref:ABC transporter domain-containing protein n=1 Tax=Mesorhabditis belari TaxID=2138241 RepID=A0AAF3E8M9_9BILA